MNIQMRWCKKGDKESILFWKKVGEVKESVGLKEVSFWVMCFCFFFVL